MKITGEQAKDIKLAYIGGGSRGWAWSLMRDLAGTKGLSGTVCLYDIDKKAAQNNRTIGNKIFNKHPELAEWQYECADSLKEALTGADFIIISIMPGTFEEMAYDVTLPQKYGIFQPVGDSTGVGGIMRSLRTVPMIAEIAQAIKAYAPDSYVINYTNPMTVSVKTLCSVFPQIKVVGCCHEVFGTQDLFIKALKEAKGIEVTRDEINIEVSGINHFTWITKAYYKNMDLMPIYKRFVKKYKDKGFDDGRDVNWLNRVFNSAHMVKFDLTDRFGVVAAAGDRHLAEFCPAGWYLKNPEHIKSYRFELTDIDWRQRDLEERKLRAQRLASGEEELKLKESGELGVRMIKALCGLDSFKTNVNTVNMGQMPQAPLGAVVETNAMFSGIGIEPIVSKTPLPDAVYAMVERIIRLQEMTVKAALSYDLDLAFKAFVSDPLNTLDLKESKELFDKMIQGTSKYLPEQYFPQSKIGA